MKSALAILALVAAMTNLVTAAPASIGEHLHISDMDNTDELVLHFDSMSGTATVYNDMSTNLYYSTVAKTSGFGSTWTTLSTSSSTTIAATEHMLLTDDDGSSLAAAPHNGDWSAVIDHRLTLQEQGESNFITLTCGSKKIEGICTAAFDTLNNCVSEDDGVTWDAVGDDLVTFSRNTQIIVADCDNESL